jgi:predicted nucleic acid-binding protein
LAEWRHSTDSRLLAVFAPSLLGLEIVNVAGRRWRWGEPALVELAAALDELGFELRDPELSRVARWTAHGLTAYDAAYVALADAEAIQLVTDDDLLVTAAPKIATALAGHRGAALTRHAEPAKYWDGES